MLFLNENYVKTCMQSKFQQPQGREAIKEIVGKKMTVYLSNEAGTMSPQLR